MSSPQRTPEPGGEAHGQRPHRLAQADEALEDRRTLLVVREGVAGDEAVRLALVLGPGAVGHVPHRVDVATKPSALVGEGDEGAQAGADVLHAGRCQLRPGGVEQGFGMRRRPGRDLELAEGGEAPRREACPPGAPGSAATARPGRGDRRWPTRPPCGARRGRTRGGRRSLDALRSRGPGRERRLRWRPCRTRGCCRRRRQPPGNGTHHGRGHRCGCRLRTRRVASCGTCGGGRPSCFLQD